MSSTTATLKTNGGQLIPQVYVPATTTYEAVAGRQVGSSEFAIQMVPRGLNPSAFESIAAATSSKALNSTTYGSAIYAVAEVQGGPVYFRLDGTAPTTALGHLADDTDYLTLESSGEIANFRFVRGSTSAVSMVITYST